MALSSKFQIQKSAIFTFLERNVKEVFLTIVESSNFFKLKILKKSAFFDKEYFLEWLF